jgi:cysteine desulfurase/selenocysteine lyase
MFNPLKLRRDFPIYTHQPDLVYLDSAASSLKPTPVVDAVFDYYTKYTANIHRGIYHLSERATEAYEQARADIAKFVNAQTSEVIFTRNATEAINLVAATWGQQNLTTNDQILTTILEHHANFLPWQQLAKQTSAEVIFLPLIEHQTVLTKNNLKNHLDQLITPQTKLLALSHVSNVLGTIHPIKQLIATAKQINPHIITIIDGAQAIPHLPVDVQDLGCDFYAFSGHKMLGPTGIGVLWGRQELLQQMPPYQLGGEMILRVTTDQVEYKPIPHKFEAGTPHIAGAIGLGTAVNYLTKLGLKNVQEHEHQLTDYGLRALQSIKGLRLVGSTDPQHRAGVISFTVDGLHPHDLAQILDTDHICIRAGHHCAMPLHQHLGLHATARASFYVYNTIQDIDKLHAGLEKAIHTLTGSGSR